MDEIEIIYMSGDETLLKPQPVALLTYVAAIVQAKAKRDGRTFDEALNDIITEWCMMYNELPR